MAGGKKRDRRRRGEGEDHGGEACKVAKGGEGPKGIIAHAPLRQNFRTQADPGTPVAVRR